ncbi:MAG TPA: VanW family protein [Sandaracinaceae bacterium LLY-WYZ-13_1]|nr:VanW family protein [Sandaracinaceae bacterium LLY-WYZ-13_1]
MEDGTSLLERLRVGAAVTCFAAAGGLGAWVLAQDEPSIARAAAPAAEVLVAGVEAPKGTDADRLAAELAEEWARQRLTLVVPDEEPLARTRRAFGARLDAERLAARIRQATDTTSAMRRLHARVAGEGGRLRVPLPIEVDERAMFERLADRKDRYDRPPRDARFNPRTGELREHQHGRMLDVHGTLDAIRRGLETGAELVHADVQPRPARRTTEDLEGLDVSHVLGRYETRYANTAESRDRTFNLRVAAAKIDGLVVLPGEVFDFNEAVGERSEANGFRPAPVIAGGELVDGVGGGTCQVAGSLHAAVFFAGLPIVERQPHSRPSTYIYMGLDAVVSYPQLNLRFRNDLDFPVVLGFTVEGGVARAEIRGAETNRMVTFVRRVDEITAYEEREVEDSSLPAGVRVLRQRGVPGFEVTNFRVVRDLDTNQATRESYSDTYPPTTQIWRVGTGGQPPADYSPPEGDTHGEYTADGYLEVTQGQGVRGTRTVRRAGRSGSYGWTERMGFPQPDPSRFE